MSVFFETLNLWDQALFKAVNLGLANPFLDWLMPILSYPGYLAVPLAALGVFLILRQGSLGLWVLAGVGLVLLLADFTGSHYLRPALGRLRPYAALEGIRHFHGLWSLTTARTLAEAAGSFGLPSLHAANTFGLAVYAAWFFRRTWAWLLPLAGAVGFSRIYLGVHYPGDVLAGFVWGALAGSLAAGVVKVVRGWLGPFVDPRIEALRGRVRAWRPGGSGAGRRPPGSAGRG